MSSPINWDTIQVVFVGQFVNGRMRDSNGTYFIPPSATVTVLSHQDDPSLDGVGIVRDHPTDGLFVKIGVSGGGPPWVSLVTGKTQPNTYLVGSPKVGDATQGVTHG